MAGRIAGGGPGVRPGTDAGAGAPRAGLRRPRLPEAWRDALSGLSQNRSLTAWSVVTIALSLFLAGAVAMTNLMVGDALGTIESEVTIYAYVDDAAPQEAIDAFMGKMRDTAGVREVSLTTKDQAWEDYRRMMGEDADKALEALDGQNPLPASVVVMMGDANEVPAMAEAIESDPDFAAIADGGKPASSVTYGKQQVSQLLAFTNTMRVALVAFAAILVCVAGVLIGSTIRNTIASRAEEIGIMRLVGASRGFIRRPFVYEGVIQAVAGSLLAMAGLLAMQLAWVPLLTQAMAFLHIDVAAWQYAAVYAGVLALGVAVGEVASRLAIRKHLLA